MSDIRICKLCGATFNPKTNRQMCCMQPKERICAVCGKQFTTICTTTENKQTCSKECSAKYAAIRRKEEAAKLTRTCKYCGQIFNPKSKRDVYCYNSHFKTCEVCGKQFEIDVRHDQSVKTCSDKCRYILMSTSTDYDKSTATMKKHMLSKYGVDNVAKLDSVKQKAKQTCLEKYGKEFYTQTDEYRKSVEATCLEKYGTSHHLKSNQVIQKRKHTCLQKYGVDNVSKTKEVQSRIKQVWNDKYGVTNVSKLNISNLTEWKLFLKDPRTYIINHFDSPTVNELACYFGTCVTSIYNNLDVKANTDILSKSYSNMEDDIVDFLHSLDETIVIERNNRTILNPYELDIYLPSYKLAIECNPTATHNSTIADPWGGYPKDKFYHITKSDKCEEHHIQLIHIFGYEWKYKKDIVKSILASKLAKNYKLYARNCVIREVNNEDCCNFLDENHRQGKAISKVRLGLYHQDELVSIMTFSHMRTTIGTGKEDLSDCWELVRFCSKLNTTVVGGASKLFKYFVNNYHPSRIRSFSDRAHTSGKVYPLLRFTEIRRSDPGYMWVNLNTDRAINRVACQKQNIDKLFPNEIIDKSLTEKEIMTAHGFVQVFDSGTILWEWTS